MGNTPAAAQLAKGVGRPSSLLCPAALHGPGRPIETRFEWTARRGEARAWRNACSWAPSSLKCCQPGVRGSSIRLFGLDTFSAAPALSRIMRMVVWSRALWASRLQVSTRAALAPSALRLQLPLRTPQAEPLWLTSLALLRGRRDPRMSRGASGRSV
ncbi:hypothetical protein PHYPSEUDO_005460 [Phytophthora pseudosyringae]|uniref:Uncharacterized protein n=1 Tax=Phytophthora pseudosyringae TaxID=221518 RepID=A0A8T1VPE6_9STRA|nr:hypothetical protein PHYPSEUDO_005460 [Phytophthora pseudosyringae]